MKILIIDNGSITKTGDSYKTNALNGMFLNDLIKCGYSINYFQFVIHKDNTLNSFDLNINGISCIPLKVYRAKILRYIVGYIKLTKAIFQNDFIYFYYPNPFKYGIFLCNLFNKRFGLYIRGMNGIKSSFSKKTYHKANVILTVSNQFTNYINDYLKVTKAETIRPMISFTDKDVVTSRDYTPKKNYKLLFLGRISYDKGIYELLAAIKTIKEEGYNIELDIVGSGGDQEVFKLIKEYKIEGIINFVGPIYDPDKIKQFYLSADLYILPTYHEGFPRTLYEAMIFGTPIVTTFVGGIPALMKEGYNCKEITPKSIESIVTAIEFAINNYQEMGKMAKNGTKTIWKIVNPNRLTHGNHLNKKIQENAQ